MEQERLKQRKEHRDTYIAGIRKGLELAANKCWDVTLDHATLEDRIAVAHGLDPETPIHEYLSSKCASRIRALADEVE